MNGQLNQQSRLFRLPRAMLTPIGQPRRAGGVFIEQFHNILSVFFCHMHLTSYLLSRHFFFVSCQFVTKHGDCFEQLDHADTHRVNLGVARGLVLECILYLLLQCTFSFLFFFFIFLFSHQIIAKQLLPYLLSVIQHIYTSTISPTSNSKIDFQMNVCIIAALIDFFLCLCLI